MSGARLNPVSINPGPSPIRIRSTTAGGPTTAAPATLTAEAAKVIANSLKVDGQLKGRVSDTFDGDHTKTWNFMNAFDLFWMTNEDSSVMKTTYRQSTFFLGLLQGPKVDNWVLTQATVLRTKVARGTAKDNETLWDDL